MVLPQTSTKEERYHMQKHDAILGFCHINFTKSQCT